MSAQRGRPPKPAPQWQTILTLNQALLYVRGQGGRMARPKLHKAIVSGDLPAFEDQLRHDPLGRALICVTRVDMDAWMNGALRPIQAASLAS